MSMLDRRTVIASMLAAPFMGVASPARAARNPEHSIMGDSRYFTFVVSAIYHNPADPMLVEFATGRHSWRDRFPGEPNSYGGQVHAELRDRTGRFVPYPNVGVQLYVWRTARRGLESVRAYEGSGMVERGVRAGYAQYPILENVGPPDYCFDVQLAGGESMIAFPKEFFTRETIAEWCAPPTFATLMPKGRHSIPYPEGEVPWAHVKRGYHWVTSFFLSTETVPGRPAVAHGPAPYSAPRHHAASRQPSAAFAGPAPGGSARR